jgi:hypothetical protein
MEQRLTLVQPRVGRTADKHIVGLYRCTCGAEVRVAQSRVRNGYTKSCGCLVREISSWQSRTHGMRGTPEYSSWQSMKGRCLDPNNKDFPRWGGRGVTVFQDWIESFEAFYDHVGPRPKGTSLDRIDNRRGYEPGNVRWATPTQQQRNRRGAYRWHIKGQVFESHTAAAEFFKVSEHTIWRWVNGQFDRRRNTFSQAREDCHVTSRY